MHRSLTRMLGMLALLAVAGYGCADQSMPFETIAAPTVRVGGPFLSVSPVERTVDVLERDVPLSRDVVVSRVITQRGGVIHVPAVGLRLTVPTGALQRPTRISVRAHAGSAVAYSFEPHGTQFDRVVIAEQSLRGTQAEGESARISGRGYFSSPDAINFSSNRASVSEVSLVHEDHVEGAVRFYLNHFSGYLVAID